MDKDNNPCESWIPGQCNEIGDWYLLTFNSSDTFCAFPLKVPSEVLTSTISSKIEKYEFRYW